MKEKLWAGSIVFFAAFLAGTVAMTGCSPTPSPQPPPDAVSVGSTSGTATCESVCDHGATLRCKWATPTPNGKPCVAVCAQAQTVSPWNLSCRATAADCAAGDACEK